MADSTLSVVRTRAMLRDGEARELRLAAGLSHAAVARRVGVTPSCVRGWEHGLYAPKGEHAVRYERLLRQLRREQVR